MCLCWHCLPVPVHTSLFLPSDSGMPSNHHSDVAVVVTTYRFEKHELSLFCFGTKQIRLCNLVRHATYCHSSLVQSCQNSTGSLKIVSTASIPRRISAGLFRVANSSSSKHPEYTESVARFTSPEILTKSGQALEPCIRSHLPGDWHLS